MCGICGVFHTNSRPVSSTNIARMTQAIAHRGPDGDGIWINGSIGLGHRRLAIIDLTPSGHQPMRNETGDIVISYNGELYNHPALRLVLEAAGHRYHSRSDTETMIHAYEEWGIDCLQRFNGMFAFALWDQCLQRLYLAVDRFGVKPLYYYSDGKKLVFASEIKAILSYPGVPRDVCYPALSEYFTFQNVLTDLTLFHGIKLIPAGHYLLLDAKQEMKISIHQYWDYDFTQQISISFEDATDELYNLFNAAVTRQLLSDVPIATYLSGGLDSGSITAIARQQLGRLRTFTGGFDLSSASGLELGFDERANSETLSNLLKTEHYEIVLHAGDMEEVMPELIWHLEDLRVGQCYPNYYVARLASKFVKVVLSGAGGDELFGGYPWRYESGINSRDASNYYRNYYNFWQRLVPEKDKPAFFNPEVYRHISDYSTFDIFRNVINGAKLPLETKDDFVNASLYFELKTFLHGLLVVEDRVSMAHSLETRVPFLDNDLVDFACRIPPRQKLSNIERHLHRINRVDENEPNKQQRNKLQTRDGKLILRHAMERIIPDKITARVKQGFSAPDASWFRGESIDYVNLLLRNPNARIYDFLSRTYVVNKLDEHTSGQYNHRLFIWSLLSFEWWLRKFM